jgi:ubiquinone/menaquinone biosynthesis C-methylase UbiE
MKNAPFDAIASDYDHSFTDTSTGRLQRQVVYQCLLSVLPQNGRVLEINCGTGEDAVWLARNGCQVVATDISEKMVQVAAKKVAEAGLSDRVQVSIADASDLEKSSIAGQFDLIFSNFGGLNCLSPAQIRTFSAAAKKRLKPTGRLVLVVMGRFCWWESLYFLLKGNRKAAFRRRSKCAVPARLDDQTTVDTWYYSPQELAKLMPEFQSLRTEAVGFWLPPSYLDPFFSRFPRVLQLLNWLERRSRGAVFAGGADHFLVIRY